MKLFLLLTSFLFNVSTWALVDIEENGHNIESPQTNLRLSVADDVPQVILTSNEVTASTDGSTCLVKLVEFCVNTYDQGDANNRLEYEFYINGKRYWPVRSHVSLQRGCRAFKNLPVKSIPVGIMKFKTVEKDPGLFDKDDIAYAVKLISPSCAGGPITMKTTEGNVATFELHKTPKCMKWCLHQKWIGCKYFPNCPVGYTKTRYENGPCYMGSQRIVCEQRYRCPC